MGWFSGGNKEKDKGKPSKDTSNKGTGSKKSGGFFGYDSFKDATDGGGKGGSGASYSSMSNKDYKKAGGKDAVSGQRPSGWTDRGGTRTGLDGLTRSAGFRAGMGLLTGGLPGLFGGLAASNFSNSGASQKGNPDNIDGMSDSAIDRFDASRPKARPKNLGANRMPDNSIGSSDRDNSGGLPAVAETFTPAAPTVLDMTQNAQTEMPAGGRIPNPNWVVGMPEDQRYLINPSYEQIIAYRNSVKSMADGGIASLEEEMPSEGISSLVPRNDKEIIVDAIRAMRGDIDDPQAAIEAFVSKYGEDKLSDLYDRVQSGELDSVASREDGVLKGPGDGMDDMIPASIDGKEDLRIADNEHVISADVVAALGNGSSDAGHKRLKEMTGRIRQKAHGSKKQQNEVNPSEVLPA
jgi:hypothetical protein